MATVTELMQNAASGGRDGERTATRVYLVEYDTATTGSPVAAAAETGIPNYLDAHPDDSALLVDDIRATVQESENSSVYKVNVTYKQTTVLDDDYQGKERWTWKLATETQHVSAIPSQSKRTSWDLNASGTAVESDPGIGTAINDSEDEVKGLDKGFPAAQLTIEKSLAAADITSTFIATHFAALDHVNHEPWPVSGKYEGFFATGEALLWDVGITDPLTDLASVAYLIIYRKNYTETVTVYGLTKPSGELVIADDDVTVSATGHQHLWLRQKKLTAGSDAQICTHRINLDTHYESTDFVDLGLTGPA